MLKLKGFQRIRAMDGDGVSVQFHIPFHVLIPVTGSMDFPTISCSLELLPQCPVGICGSRTKASGAAWATVKHVKETLKELICISLSLALSFSDSPPIKLPPTSSFHFIRGTVVGKRDS